MQKRSTRSLQLAALLAASASAQTITSTIPVCPTASSTTITLPTTVTFCPGPNCNGGAAGPMITGAPNNGVGMQGHFLGDYTSVGADGKTTVLGIHETVYDSLCSTGLVPATWTITEECGCTGAPAATVMPVGFETTVVPCSVCGPQTMVTLTQPCATGPYASQTPTVNQAPAAAAAAPAGQAVPAAPAAAVASAGAGAGASAGAVSNPGSASAGAGSGAGANAVSPAAASAAPAAPAGQAPAAASAGAGAGAGATAQGSNGAAAGAGSGSDAAAQVGANGAAASADAGAGASANAGTVSPAGAAGAAAAPAAGMAVAPTNGTMAATNGTPPVSSPVAVYDSSATHASIAGFTIFAGIIAALLL